MKAQLVFAVLFTVLLAGCGQPPLGAVQSLPPAPSADASPLPSLVPQPTAQLQRATTLPTQLPYPVATATLPAPTATPLPTLEPTPAPGDLGLPLRIEGQAPALLPEFAADLTAAADWNRYTIDARLDPNTLTITGRQTVEYINRTGTPLSQMYFHLYGNHPALLGAMSVAEVAIDGVAVEPVYEQNSLLMRLDLLQPLAPDASAVITLTFQTTTPANASARGYGAFNYEAGVWSLASFYPVLAVDGPQGWDTYPVDARGDLVNSETALYQVRLHMPLGWTLTTTGVPVADVRDDAGQTVTFVSGPQRDFFIAALQGLDQVSATVEGVRVTSYYQPQNASGGQQALEAALRSVELFNARFGRYPLAELEVVQVAATTFLGVEYPGIVLIEQGLYNGSRSLETIVAHEVAHQWWYSLVGNDVQREAWLDEALASYAQVVYHEAVNGPEAAEAELNELRARYGRARNAGNDTVVAQPNDQFPRGTYYPIVYGKAPLFIHALRQQLGDDVFFRFLQSYYANERYALATGSDLLSAAEGSCSCELDEFYADWITRVTPVAIP